ncbi:MAG: hypothetical protein KatS3mg077_1077 [Candidatus Binatia bacterium]|nr:MAG: hypothetical protein KatS3mg077_1077 [Candidatus Binatia bacterium]
MGMSCPQDGPHENVGNVRLKMLADFHWLGVETKGAVLEGGVAHVLVVEDNPVHARMVQRWLENVSDPLTAQYVVTVADSIESACAILQERSFDAIILDLVLPDCPEEETLARVRAASVAPIVVLSSVRDEQVAMQSLRQGAQDYLIKGQVDPDRLHRAVRYAIERHALEVELRKQNQALRALSECNRVVGAARSESELYREICRVIVRRGGYRFAWLGFVRDGTPPKIEPEAWYGFAESYLDGICITLDDSPTSRGPGAKAVRTGRTQRVVDVMTDEAFAPWRERARKHGYRSLIALPIVVRGGVMGALCVYSEQVDAFGAQAVSWLEELAANLAVGIERLRAEQERDSAEEAKRRAESRFRLLAEVSPVGVLCGTSEGAWTYVNDRACQILGRLRQDLLGQRWKQFVHEEDRQRLEYDWQAWRDASMGDTEVRFRRPDGEVVWVNLQLTITHREDEGGLIFVGTLTDVTARRRAEEALERLTSDLERLVAVRTRELENALHEIESFYHSLAHDIRAPLRRVVAYCELLKLRCAPELTEQARHYVHLARSNAARLDQLVEDLLNLSRVRTHALRFREVNLTEMCERILRTLHEADPERQIRQIVAPDVYAWADSNLIEVVLANLLENAWKYTRGREMAEIEFGVEQRGAEAVYFVRDNGCGFDPALTRELFKPFTRLPGSEAFDGTGIGLATVQRIVARHGGRVWATGEPDKGATFYFALPLSRSPSQRSEEGAGDAVPDLPGDLGTKPW